MSNELFEAVSTAVLVLYLVVLVFALRHQRTPLLLLNAITAVVIIAYDVQPLRYILEDWRLQAIVAFEIAAIVAALLAFRGNRPGLYFSYAAFAINLCIVIAATYLAFFFRITRLI
jgi:hypothetical protein